MNILCPQFIRYQAAIEQDNGQVWYLLGMLQRHSVVANNT